jgi:hypothetical protein
MVSTADWAAATRWPHVATPGGTLPSQVPLQY